MADSVTPDREQERKRNGSPVHRLTRIAQSLSRIFKSLRRGNADPFLRAIRLACASIDAGVIVVNGDGVIAAVNPAACRLLGFRQEELIGRNSHTTWRGRRQTGDSTAGQSCRILHALKTTHSCSTDQEAFYCKDGTTIPVQYTALPFSGPGLSTHVIVVFDDISARRTAESRQRLWADVLRTLNSEESLQRVISQVLELIKNASGLDAVGLRLREGRQFPLFREHGTASSSSTADFSTCVNREQEGQRISLAGEPVLHCTCELVTTGQINPHIPCFTAGGSFWTNHSSELYSLEARDGSYLNVCNRCINTDCESVALIPLASRDGAIGMLQLSDRRPRCFTLEMVQFYEDLAHCIALAVKRRQAEEQVRQRERWYRVLFDCSHDAIITLAPPSWKLTSANDTAKRVFGVPDGNELILRELWDFCPPVQPDGRRSEEKAQEVIDIAMRNGAHLFEWTHQRADGEPFACSVLLTRVELESQTFLQATIRDISSQKRVEDDRVLNLQRMEAILELSHMTESTDDSLLASVIDDVVRLTRSDCGFLAEWNGSTSHLSTRHISAFANDANTTPCPSNDNLSRWHSSCDECIRSRTPVVVNKPTIGGSPTCDTPTNSTDIHRHIVIPLFAGSELVAVAGVANKRTAYDESDVRQLQLLLEGWQQLEERIHASQQLQAAREHATAEALKLRSMIEGMAEGVVVADSHDIVTEANRWLLDKLGLKRENVVGKSLWDFHPDTEVGGRVRTIIDSFRHGQNEQVHVVNRELLGMHLSLRVQPIFESGRYRGIILNAVDVTDIVHAREAAEEATRTKSQFLANMSHEIRTPMTAILGFNDMVLDETNQPEVREAAEIVKRNGEQLLRLINDILDISRIEAGNLRVDLVRWSPRQIIADVISLLHVKASAKGLTLIDQYDGALPETITTDPDRLRQILINLVGNAVKFTDHGSVRIVTRLLANAKEGPLLQVEVVDTGMGIPEDDLDKLFGAFVQVDGSASRRHDGTGLGLAISRRLARALGGDVCVSSRVGQGSTFTVTVGTGMLEGPVSASNRPLRESPDEWGPASTVELPCEPGFRILLAEDNPDNQRLISVTVRRAGYEVEIVGNGQEVIDLVQAARATHDTASFPPQRDFAVILMDMQMPVLDGYRATEQLRNAGYSRPIIALTAHAMRDDREKCIAAGCDDYLPKPVNKLDLLEMLRKWAPQACPTTPTP